LEQIEGLKKGNFQNHISNISDNSNKKNIDSSKIINLLLNERNILLIGAVFLIVLSVSIVIFGNPIIPANFPNTTGTPDLTTNAGRAISQPVDHSTSTETLGDMHGLKILNLVEWDESGGLGVYYVGASVVNTADTDFRGSITFRYNICDEILENERVYITIKSHEIKKVAVMNGQYYMSCPDKSKPFSAEIIKVYPYE